MITHDKNSTDSMPAIELRGVSKRFGDLTAVDQLHLSINKGEIFGFLGPNGAGKTTTINMMSGLLKSDAGSIHLLNQLMQPDNVVLKRKIGICPQEIIVWQKLTCLEQLQFIGQMYRMPADLAKKRGEQLLSDLGLTDKRHTVASKLSGGMQRRLNFIMALIHDPEVIILDEPEAGLDPQSRVLLRDYIRSLAKQKTVIFTTHNMDEADRICDLVAIIDQGALLKLDTPDNLKATVGGGHVLEIEIGEIQTAQKAIAELKTKSLQVILVGQSLVIRGTDLVHRLTTIMQIMQQNMISINEFKLRENSLEDVFIALTGRRLRE